MIIPIPAEKNRKTLERILQTLQEGNSPLPYNPKMPTLPEIEGDCPSAICLFTSGTTAAPKIAITPIACHVAAAKPANQEFSLKKGDGWLLNLPFFHTSGLAKYFRCKEAGAILLFEDDDPKLVTHISMVATQLARLINGENPYPNLRTIVVGGSAIPKNLIDKARLQGFEVHYTYGMTEMCSSIATEKGLLPGVEAKIVDGEIFVRGPSLFSGYLNRPSPFIDGWFPTGDRGELHGKILKVHGRKDRMFISGGENIHPEEIEEALQKHPCITNARVEPRKCEEYGQKPLAYINTTKKLSESDLITFLKDKLISWKIPSVFLQNVE